MYNSVLKHAHSVNMMFSEPLPYSKIKATSKSIAKYCWKRDAHYYNEFIYRQALLELYVFRIDNISYYLAECFACLGVSAFLLLVLIV